MNNVTKNIIIVILILSNIIAVAAFLVSRKINQYPKQDFASIPLTLSNYNKLLKDNVIIVLGANASSIENEGAQLIANNLTNLGNSVPAIKTDIGITDYEKARNNLILIGKPGVNNVLNDVYHKTNSRSLINEYLSEGKGIIEIIENPWNKNKVIIIITGNDELGIRAGEEKIGQNQNLEDSPTSFADWEDVEVKSPPESAADASLITSSNYEIVNVSNLIEDKGEYWLLYDHDTTGSVEDPYFRYSSEAIVIKLNPTNSVKYFMGGSDWRGLEVLGSPDGNSYESLKGTCCYGSGEYVVDTQKYEQPFYLKFVLSSGACCGKGSYVTLSKKILLLGDKCIDSDGGKNYFSDGVITGNKDSVEFNRNDICTDEKTLEEQYCNDQLKPASIKYTCADSCSDGRCVSKANIDSGSFWQMGKSGTVRKLDLNTSPETLNIAFAASGPHPYTGSVYLVTSALQTMQNKKFAVTTELDKSSRENYYDEHAAVIVISPEKYLDADLMDDEADNSPVHFTTGLRCYSMLNDVNNGKINYTCVKRENGKTSVLFDEKISQGVDSTKAEWIFNFESSTITITLKTPLMTREYAIVDPMFISKLANSYLYLGEFSSSNGYDGIKITDVILGGEKLDMSFEKKNESEDKIINDFKNDINNTIEFEEINR